MSTVRRNLLKFLICLPILMLCAAPATTVEGKTPTPGKVEGTLVAKSANSVSILTASKKTVTLKVTSATKIELNNRRSTLRKLPIGARTQALFDPATRVASKVQATT